MTRNLAIRTMRNVRYSGTVAAERAKDPCLAPIDAGLIPAVIDYDRAFFPAPRTDFLRCWLSGSPSRQSWACVECGVLKGYGTVRQCRTGWKIGPLFAADEGRADLLFRQLASRTGPGPVILDLPEPNDRALGLAIH